MKKKSDTFLSQVHDHRLVYYFILIALICLSGLPGYAQTNSKVSGVVLSATDNLPLIGVNIVQKGTTNGVVTDINGNFEFSVPSNATLTISYIGYVEQEVKVTSATRRFNVLLREDSQTLDEVVVVGYGVQKKKLECLQDGFFAECTGVCDDDERGTGQFRSEAV